MIDRCYLKADPSVVGEINIVILVQSNILDVCSKKKKIYTLEYQI